MRPLCYLNTAKGNAGTLMQAFAEGSGAEITQHLEFVPGREAVFWGVDRATLHIWEKVVETKTPYIYMDNGYFKSRWHGGDHYRITRNAEQCSGEGVSDGERWRALGLQIKPWARSGRHVLIACNSDFWHERHGDVNVSAFGSKVKNMLAEYTKRPVIIRGKPIGGHKEPPLAEHLRDCWAVVTYSSIVAAEALLAGIPAFVLARGAMGTVAKSDLSEIENPMYPEGRERWASVLADNQWRIGEIKNGAAWGMLTSKGANGI